MTPQQRSKCMRNIRGKNTKPELLVRKFLYSKGFRYRLNLKNLPGSPDIVLKKYKTVIFVNGCFWHGHNNCRYYKEPKTNAIFWRHKILVNKERDLQNLIDLRRQGWHTIILWECQLKSKNRDLTLKGLEKTLCHIYLTDQK